LANALSVMVFFVRMDALADTLVRLIIVDLNGLI
jgi:hypothetical protein